jgi:hypothetical protein
MYPFTRTFICPVLLSAVSLLAQKVETQSHDQSKVMRVETSPDHLTVIELGDPVTMVAVGNQSSFMIERRENKVLVKPTEDGAKTNLFIWTSAGRYSYELVPASTVEEMHFAIDPPPAPMAFKLPPPPPSAAKPVPEIGPLRDMLAAAHPVSVYGGRDTKGGIEVTVRSLYRRGTRLYLQYILTNHARDPYQPSSPSVWHLAAVRSRLSLIPLGDIQLGEKLARSLQVDAALPIRIVEGDQSPKLGTGQTGMGWLVIEEPTANAGTQVLRLQFPPAGKGSVDAVLVLKHREASSDEVAH